MSATTLEFGPTDSETLARRFLESLRAGRLVDALETLSPDATVSDGNGPDRHGLREITASLLAYRTPDRLVAEGIVAQGTVVSASVRIPRGPGIAPRRYRARIEIRHGRIQAVRLRPQ